MFNIIIPGERVRETKTGKLERVSYKRVVVANSMDELDERLDEIPEMTVIKESKGISCIERVSAIKIA